MVAATRDVDASSWKWTAFASIDNTEGTVQLRAVFDKGQIIHHPTPNYLDPNDPLLWPTWKKHTCFFAICAFTLLTNFGIGGMAPAFYRLSEEFNQSQASASQLLIWPVLVLGAFNFVWVPLANYYGKRPVFVFNSLLLSVCFVWGAVSPSFKSLLWSNIVGAFAGSSTEALGSALVSDLYFLHERSTKMSIYIYAINGGNTLGPLICGFIVNGTTWRWYKWIAFILTFLDFLLILLFAPETRYDRSSVLQGYATSGSASSPTARSLDLTGEKTAPREMIVGSSTVGKDAEIQMSENERGVPKNSWIQELSLWSGKLQHANLLKLFLRPLPLIAYPAVMLAFLGYAVSLACVLAVNILNSFVLQTAPYNWRPDINGLINIPGLIGAVSGAVLAGWPVDKYCDKQSKRNAGVFVPETRLHLLIIPLLISPAGCLAFGYGVGEHLPWPAIFIGYGMVYFGLTFVPTVTMTYVSDCYYAVNADALELVNGLKNIVAFGLLYAVPPWVDSVGYVNCFGTLAAVFAVIMILAVPIIIYGKHIRHETGQWRLILE